MLRLIGQRVLKHRYHSSDVRVVTTSHDGVVLPDCLDRKDADQSHFLYLDARRWCARDGDEHSLATRKLYRAAAHDFVVCVVGYGTNMAFCFHPLQRR